MPPPLPLSVTLLPPSQVIHFFTSVRGKEMRQLTISNKTNSTWLLKPIIDGEYWSGPESISIPPNQNHHYDLTYQPLVMTPEPTKHQVCPRGCSLLYACYKRCHGLFVCKATNFFLPPHRAPSFSRCLMGVVCCITCLGQPSPQSRLGVCSRRSRAKHITQSCWLSRTGSRGHRGVCVPPPTPPFFVVVFTWCRVESLNFFVPNEDSR